MTQKEIALYRLVNLQIAQHTIHTPGEMVAYLGAMQAQDFPGAKWALGLRIPGTTDAGIEQAIADRKIVRTWPMRGTLHFVAPGDVRWMLQLMASRVLAGSKGRLKQLELDDKTLLKSKKILVKELQGGKQIARNELYSILDKNKISTEGQRGIHILSHAAHEGLICFGSHNEKQPTFTLLDEWIPAGKKLSQEEALAEVALRYFTSHGPATLQDFVWWTGLKVADAKTAVQLVQEKMHTIEINKTAYIMGQNLPDISKLSPDVYLLPGFDEYMLGYKDRSAALDPLHMPKVVPGNNGMFMPTLIIKGKIEGTWKRPVKKDKIKLQITPFLRLTKTAKAGVTAAAKLYGKYMQLPVQIEEI
ncbi:winged helix DNA-binding domain-containing protein [Chitinophagaceae bacterium MMS25-I14]